MHNGVDQKIKQLEKDAVENLNCANVMRLEGKDPEADLYYAAYKECMQKLKKIRNEN